MNASDSTSNLDEGEITSVSRVRVRYAETDAMGWVYYACYLHYFEVARSELIRGIWKSYRKIEEEDGLRLPVIETGCSYLSGARYEDELDIHTAMRIDGARIHFKYFVKQSATQEPVARGFTVHCFADHSGRPKRMPTEFLKLFSR